MSVQVIEGFEGGSLGLISGGASGGAFIHDTLTSGFWSGASYHVGVSTEYMALKDATGTRYFGAVRVYITNFNKGVVGISNSATGQHFGIGVNASGFAYISNSAQATVGTGTSPLYQNAWNLIEFDVAIGDAAAANVWVQGLSTADIVVASADFKNGAETTGTNLILFGNTGNLLDDIIVYDSSGATNNARIGDKVVAACFPSGKGTQEQWSPKKTGTVQRFYFPKALRSAVTAKDGYPAPVGVTLSSSWEYTVGTETNQPPRGRLAPEPYTTANPINSVTDSGIAYDVTGSAPWDLLGSQYVSPALGAQTISGTVTAQMLVSEETAGDNSATQLIIRAVSNDGQTVRGTLYAGDTDTTNPPSSELVVSTETNRTLPRAAVSPITLSALAISEGDRLVVEVGVRMRGAARNSVLTQYVTGANGTVDLAIDETDTTITKRPWIEFSSAITLSDDGNFDHVAEFIPDDDGTYVTTATDNLYDLYATADVASALAVSGALTIKSRAIKVDPGARSITHQLKTTGAVQSGPAIGLPSGTYGYQRSYYDTDPLDSAAWSDAKVTALEIGPKATT